jgi:hypothetical protein
MVFFKHQYITNPTVSPESHLVTVAQQLTIALQGNIPTGNKTAEALPKVSKLFTKIAMAKNELAKAKTMRNRVCTNQATQQAIIRSRKHGDTDGTSNIVLPCPGS